MLQPSITKISFNCSILFFFQISQGQWVDAILIWLPARDVLTWAIIEQSDGYKNQNCFLLSSLISNNILKIVCHFFNMENSVFRNLIVFGSWYLFKQLLSKGKWIRSWTHIGHTSHISHSFAYYGAFISSWWKLALLYRQTSSQWFRCFVQQLVQVNNKENIKTLHHWPFVREFLDWWTPLTLNTLRPRQNGCHFAEDIFKCIFQLKFHRSLFLRVQLTIFQHWFRKWLGAVQAASHYLNRWWLVCWRKYASLGLNELNNWVVFF